MVWHRISDVAPPEYGPIIYGWWCYWRDHISWEYADDPADSATHWCRLPKHPAPDPTKIPEKARAK